MSELLQWLANLVKGARFWAIIMPWEKAVRVRLGRHAAIWSPGFHLRSEFAAVHHTVRFAAPGRMNRAPLAACGYFMGE